MNDSETTLPLPFCPAVTDQEFNLFHSIDRKLYARLTGDLRRRPIESVIIMAFWMWLQREAHDTTIIPRIMNLPALTVTALFDETVMCLRCLKNGGFLFKNHNEAWHDQDLVLLLNLVIIRPCALSLRFLQENRVAVACGVRKIIDTVCARAFVDIMESALRNCKPVFSAGGGIEMPPLDYMLALEEGSQEKTIHMQRRIVEKELGDLLGWDLLNRINRVERKEKENEEDLPSDRTVFLKFIVRGCLTSYQVAEFFIRECGVNVIEELVMRDKHAASGVMVVCSMAVAKAIHGEDMKMYVIDGKHFWARRYVKGQKQYSYSSTMSPWDQ